MLFAALYFGTTESVLVAALADIIGSLAFSTYPYFPGYTLSISLSAFLFATVLKRNRGSFFILLAVFLSQSICSLGLNSLWISLNSGSPLLPIMMTRVVQVLINGSMQFFTIKFMVFYLEKKISLQEINS